jgi:uncharacterized membrane protein
VQTLSAIAALLVFRIPGAVFWPYFAGSVILTVGLASVSWTDVRHARGLEKLVPFGPLLYAVALAVFSGDHFVGARAVGRIVPSWMPWHLFWAYFVGVALIAAALSISAQRESQLAAAMVGVMLVLFVLMIHAPNYLAAPHDRMRFTLVLRESSLSAGAFAFAAAQAQQWRRGAYRGLGLALGSRAWGKSTVIARIVMGVATADFGIQQFLFPTFAPGIPQDGAEVIIRMPNWLPAHALWAYISGTIFVACGIALLLNRRARVAADIVAATILVLMAFVYVPLTIKNASNIDLGLNYLAIHSMLAGALLLLARALPKKLTEEIAVGAVHAGSARRAGTASKPQEITFSNL